MKLLIVTFTLFVPAIALSADGESNVTGFEWETVIKGIGALIGVIVTYIQVRAALPTSRGALKVDLEILKLLDKSDPNYNMIKNSLDSRIQRCYAETSKVIVWPTVILGIVWALGFAYWTFYIVRDGFSWWSLLTGYLSLAGLGWIVIGSGRFKTEPTRK